MVLWLLVARPEVPSTRSRYSVKDEKATINLDSDPDGVAGDARDNIAKVNIMFD